MVPKPAIRIALQENASRIAVLGAHVWIHTYAEAGVNDVIARYVLEAFNPDKIQSVFDDSTATLFVAEVQGNLVGYIVVRVGSYHADVSIEIETLYIYNSFTRQGIGSALLTRARDFAMTQTGNRSIWLGVNAKNERAISFYRSQGMKQDGLMYFELGGKKHANIVMLAADL